MSRVGLAFACFFRVLRGKPLPPEALPPADAPPPQLAAPATAPKAEPAKPARTSSNQDGALLLLAMFQREGRLVDFLRETLDGHDDATVGALARDIHRGLKKVLDAHVTLEHVMPGDEGSGVTLPAGFDPSRVRVVGNVTGSPPWKGTLKHHGWRASKVNLPKLAEGMDASVVAPAEVELP